MEPQNGTSDSAERGSSFANSVLCDLGLPEVATPEPMSLVERADAVVYALDEFRRTGDGRALLRNALRIDGRLGSPAAARPAEGEDTKWWRVVIPVRGAHDALRMCLGTIARRWRPGPWSLRLVCSQDEAAAIDRMVEDAFSGLSHGVARSVLVAPEPRGFAKASNDGACAVDPKDDWLWPLGDRILFLNSDAIPYFPGPQVFDDVLDVAVAAGPSGENVSGFQGAVGEMSAEHRFMASRAVVAPVPRLVGWCLAVRRAEFEYVGGWDEGFGIGNFDDDDLSLRLALAASGDPRTIPLAWCPSVFCGHVGSASFNELPDAAHVYQDAMTRNRARFMARWGWAQEAIMEWWMHRGWTRGGVR